MDKKLFHVWDASFMYSFDVWAFPDPENEGEWVRPVAGTDIPLIPHVDGKARFFNINTKEWYYRTDNRGIWYDAYRVPQQINDFEAVINPAWSREPRAFSIDELIDNRLRDIQLKCEEELQAMTAAYPQAELLSWSKQESEARAYRVNANSPTPLLDALQEARGIDKSILVDKVLAAAAGFAVASGALIGKRQALEDRLQVLRETEDAEPADIEDVIW